jgi:low temperature requirement protein LtrA
LTPFAAVNGFVVMCAAWWLYFDTHEERIIDKDLGTGQRVLYGHLGIYSGLAIISTAIAFSVSGELNTFDHAAMTGIGVVMFIGSMVFIHGMATFASNVQRNAIAVLVIASGLMPVSGYFL